jgi:hypothetical protein
LGEDYGEAVPVARCSVLSYINSRAKTAFIGKSMDYLFIHRHAQSNVRTRLSSGKECGSSEPPVYQADPRTQGFDIIVAFSADIDKAGSLRPLTSAGDT